MKRFRTVTELDDYLMGLTDDEREELGPSPYRDQVDAAAMEGRRNAEAVLGHEAVWVPHEGIVEWVRLGMLDILLKWFDGTALTCIHRPSPNSPEPVWAAAWKPGVIVCDRCTDMLAVTGVADSTCDGCGHVCQGLPHDGITPFATFIGCLGYQVGACDSCHADVKAAEGRSRP